jgi:hypothetical protein
MQLCAATITANSSPTLVSEVDSLAREMGTRLSVKGSLWWLRVPPRYVNASMSVSDAKRLKQLEEENAKLKKMLTDATPSRMYRPLIYTVCYGSQCYFDCLSLMLKSLYVFGRYRGGILVLSDRTETQVAVPDEMTDMVRILCCDAISMSTRYQIQDFIGARDTPALCIDSDVVVTQEIDPILRKMSAESGIYVSYELGLWPQVAKVPASAIADQKGWNWFGLDLFLDDAELRDRPLLCLNAGLFGFSERRIFERPARQIHDMYTSERWSSIARYTDQPFLTMSWPNSNLSIRSC